MTAGEFLKYYTNCLTQFPDKHVEIRRNKKSIYTTIYTFLTCYSSDDFFYYGEVNYWEENKNLLTLTLIS